MTISTNVSAQKVTHCEGREGWAVFSDGVGFPAISILCGDERARALAFAWANPLDVLRLESEAQK